MEFFFAFWWFLSDISATRGRIHTKFYMCDETTQSCAALTAGVTPSLVDDV